MDRKRVRSAEEDSFGLQLKCFVDQKIINQNNSAEMMKIHAKTIKLLFQGAKTWNSIKKNEPNNNVPNNEVQKPNPANHPEKDCKLCSRKIVLHNLNAHDNEPLNVSCKNCNLDACNLCRLNCYSCGCILCVNCVNLFGCLNDLGPCCDSCKLMPYIH